MAEQWDVRILQQQYVAPAGAWLWPVRGTAKILKVGRDRASVFSLQYLETVNKFKMPRVTAASFVLCSLVSVSFFRVCNSRLLRFSNRACRSDRRS